MPQRRGRTGSTAPHSPSTSGGDAPRLQEFDFDRLRHLPVEVRAAGFRYRGIFLGADEEDLYLRGSTRWWVIRLDQVSTLRVVPVPTVEHPLARVGPIPGLDDEQTLAEGSSVTLSAEETEG